MTTKRRESLTWGVLPKKAAFVKRTKKYFPFPMEFANPGEEQALVEAVNQGIDSHLEAVHIRQFRGRYGKSGYEVEDAGSMHTLLRRLMEEGDEIDSPGAQLASSIMEVLDYEWI